MPRSAPDAELARDRGCSQTVLVAQATDLGHVDTGLTPAVDAPGLGLRDTFNLALAPKIHFEFSKHAQHVEEGLAGGGSGVDRLFGRTQRDASAPEFVDNVLQVLQRARETVDAGDNQGVAWLNEVEQHLQFGAAVAPVATFLFRTDHPASGRAQRLPLHGKVLVQRRDVCVAVGRHFVPIGSRPENRNVSECCKQPY